MKFGKLKSVDFFRKLPNDLTEATLTGASLSVVSTIIMVFLLVMEFASFMALKTETRVIVDQSPMNDLLRINFNMTFTQMSCEHLTLDVSDSLGSKKINLSKTVRKQPVSADMETKGTAMRDETLPIPEYDDHSEDVIANTNYTAPVDARQFTAALARYPVVVVNFYAPWCPFCQKLAPTWNKVGDWAHAKYPVSDGRIRIMAVDCTKEEALCAKQFITGFPSVRVYRKGSDKVVVNGMKSHEAYHGDRTSTALEKFVDGLVESAGKDAAVARIPYTRRMTLSEACQMSGFVLVKKVPGTMHFHMKSEGLSFSMEEIDVSHAVHAFTFGNKPSPRRQRTLARLHPGGLAKDWADKLQGQTFISQAAEYTHEHFMQLVRTTLQPTNGRPQSEYDAYEYTVHSHSYINEVSDFAIPAAKFSFQPSAMQVLVRELPRAWYHFLTTTCAIIGGVFTVCGILDGITFNAQRMIKKVELGKQG